jgi:hypothetical protein
MTGTVMEFGAAAERKADRRAAAELELEERLAPLRDERAAALQRYEAAKAEAERIDLEIDAAHLAFEEEFPPSSPAVAYQVIVRRNQEERRRRVETANARNEAITRLARDAGLIP